jgi:hypothetical protein
MPDRHPRRFRPRLELFEDRRLPSVFTVTNLSDDGSPGCLRSRVVAANSHIGADTIVFRPGLTGTIHLTGGQIPISDSLTLNGPGAARLAVDGNAADRIFDVDNGNAAADLTVTIRGLELRNGKASGSGAILSNENLTLIRDVIDGNHANASGAIGASGTLTLKNCTVSGNTATGNVGGVYFDGTTFTMVSSTISGNTATTGKGGGLYLYSGSCAITKSIISGNTAGKNGGGVYAYPVVTALTIASTTISGNQSFGTGNGGGVESRAGQTTITNCTVADNTAGGYAGGLFTGSATITGSVIKDNASLFEGGGITDFGGASFTLTNCTVMGNFTPVSGGGLFVQNGGATVTGCTFADNGADSGGGIFLNTSAVVTLRNSTLNGNEAQSNGGAIDTNGTSLVVHNCTIAFNRAGINTNGSTGGGIFAANGTVDLESSIVSQNTARGGKPDLNSTTGTPFTATHCLIGSAAAIIFTADATTQQLLGKDPLLSPLANNGGPTQTLAPSLGSPCIDQGTNPDGLTFDQRGRPFKRQRGLAVDIGAVERL